MRQITKIFVITFLLWTMVCGLWTITYAAVPHLINYQGRLTDSGGTPLNGSYTLTFGIYDAESGGTLLWQETQTVSIQKGIFNVLLGAVTNLDLAFDKPYWLEIKVGSDNPMSPRQRITSSGYAIRSERAEKADEVEKIKTDNLDPTAGYLSDKVDNETIESSNHRIRVKAPLSTKKGGTGLTSKMINIITYVGNGNVDRTVAHGLGTTPTVVIIGAILTGGADVWKMHIRHVNDAVGYSRTFDGLTYNNDIKSFDATNVTLGSGGAVNNNGTSYFLIAIVTQ